MGSNEVVHVLSDSGADGMAPIQRAVIKRGRKLQFLFSSESVEAAVQNASLIRVGFFDPATHHTRRKLDCIGTQVIPLAAKRAIDQDSIFDEPYHMLVNTVTGKPGQFDVSLTSAPDRVIERIGSALDFSLRPLQSAFPIESALATLAHSIFREGAIVAHKSPPFFCLFYAKNGVVIHRKLERIAQNESHGFVRSGSFESGTRERQQLLNYQSFIEQTFGEKISKILPVGSAWFTTSSELDEKSNTPLNIDLVIQNESNARRDKSLDDFAHDTFSNLCSEEHVNISASLDQISRSLKHYSRSLHFLVCNIDLIALALHNGKGNFLDKKQSRKASLYHYTSKHHSVAYALTLLMFTTLAIEYLHTVDKHQQLQKSNEIIESEAKRLSKTFPTATEVATIQQLAAVVSRQQTELRIDHLLSWISNSLPSNMKVVSLNARPARHPNAGNSNNNAVIAGKFTVSLTTSIDGEYDTAKRATTEFVSKIRAKADITTSSFNFVPKRKNEYTTLESTLSIDTNRFYEDTHG